MSKISAKDVVQFFKDADVDIAELVLEFANSAVEGKLETQKRRSDAMAKARAARKPAGTKAAETAAAASTANPIATARARRATASSSAHVPAPAHTAAATSVSSDEIIA